MQSICYVHHGNFNRLKTISISISVSISIFICIVIDVAPREVRENYLKLLFIVICVMHPTRIIKQAPGTCHPGQEILAGREDAAILAS